MVFSAGIHSDPATTAVDGWRPRRSDALAQQPFTIPSNILIPGPSRDHELAFDVSQE